MFMVMILCVCVCVNVSLTLWSVKTATYVGCSSLVHATLHVDNSTDLPSLAPVHEMNGCVCFMSPDTHTQHSNRLMANGGNVLHSIYS